MPIPCPAPHSTLYAGCDRDAVVAGLDHGADDPDVLAVPEVDAVGLGGVAGRGDGDAGHRHVLAVLYVQVDLRAVEDLDVLHVHVVARGEGERDRAAVLAARAPPRRLAGPVQGALPGHGEAVDTGEAYPFRVLVTGAVIGPVGLVFRRHQSAVDLDLHGPDNGFP